MNVLIKGFPFLCGRLYISLKSQWFLHFAALAEQGLTRGKPGLPAFNSQTH